MKKLIILVLILTLYNCKSIEKERLILKTNLEKVKKHYPNAQVTKYRHFSYIFNVDKNDTTFYVLVRSNGTIIKTNRVIVK